MPCSTFAGQTFESQSVGEGMADIMGTFIDFQYGNGDWTIAEDYEPAIRDMSNPNATQNPDTYLGTHYCADENTCYFHDNATVASHALGYLLSEGGSGVNDLGKNYAVVGIGKEKAAKIAFRTLTTKLTQASGFWDTRIGSIQSAQELYGVNSVEVAAVKDAWHAVGIGLSSLESVQFLPLYGDDNVFPWEAGFRQYINYPNLVAKLKFRISTDPNFNSANTYEKEAALMSYSPIDPNIIWTDLKAQLQPDTIETPTTIFWDVNVVAIDEGVCKRLKLRSCDELVGSSTGVRKFTPDERKTTGVKPQTGDVVYPWFLDISWNAVAGATDYEIKVCLEGDCTNNPIIITTKATIFNGEGMEKFILEKENSLLGGRKYSMQVRALSNKDVIYNQTTEGEWSDIQTFETIVPGTILVSPAFNSTLFPWARTFSWNALPGVDHYDVIYAFDQNFTQLVPTNTIGVNSLQTTGTNLTVSFPPLYDGTDIYWKVIGVSVNGDQSNSEVGKFHVNYNLTKSAITTPANGSDVPFNAPVNFVWNAIANTEQTEHTLTLGDGTFVLSTPLQNQTNLTLSGQTAASNVILGYCARVKMTGPFGYQGTISDPTCYTVEAPKPNITVPTANQIIELNGPVTITWTNANDPSNGYNVVLEKETSPGNFSVVHQYSTPASQKTIIAPIVDFQTNSNYRVKVGAVNGANTTFSNYINFKVVPQVDIPVLNSPANGATNVPLTGQVFSWDSSYAGFNAGGSPDYSGAGYYATIKETSSGAFVANQVQMGNTKTASNFNLNSNTNYTWFIEAKRPNGNFVKSSERTFTTINNSLINLSWDFNYVLPANQGPNGPYTFGITMTKPDGSIVNFNNGGSVASGTTLQCLGCQTGTYQFQLNVLTAPDWVGWQDTMDIHLDSNNEVPGLQVINLHVQDNNFVNFNPGTSHGPFLYTK